MRFRISIRTLLIGFIPLAVSLSWFIAWRTHYVRQQAVVENYLGYQARFGNTLVIGHVRYDYQYEADGSWGFSAKEAPGPAWLRKCLGENFFATVVSFKPASYKRLEELEDLNEFRCLTELKDFNLYNCSNLRSLDGLRNLKKLEVLTITISPNTKVIER